MPELKIEYLVAFAGFVLPGAISMYVYSLKVPQRDERLKDKIAESICFSILNFIIMFIPINYAFNLGFSGDAFILSYVLLVISFVVMPAFWPYVLIIMLRCFENYGWIGRRARTSWDFVFERESGCWMQIVMKDGGRIGGKFDVNSYATAYPDTGHLYLEELWTLDADGTFLEPYPGRPGIVLRPEDYDYVLIFGDDDDRQVEIANS